MDQCNCDSRWSVIITRATSKPNLLVVDRWFLVIAYLFHPSQVGFDLSSPAIKLQRAFPAYCCRYRRSSRFNKGRVFVLLQNFLNNSGFPSPHQKERLINHKTPSRLVQKSWWVVFHRPTNSFVVFHFSLKSRSLIWIWFQL